MASLLNKKEETLDELRANQKKKVYADRAHLIAAEIKSLSKDSTQVTKLKDSIAEMDSHFSNIKTVEDIPDTEKLEL